MAREATIFHWQRSRSSFHRLFAISLVAKTAAIKQIVRRRFYVRSRSLQRALRSRVLWLSASALDAERFVTLVSRRPSTNLSRYSAKIATLRPRKKRLRVYSARGLKFCESFLVAVSWNHWKNTGQKFNTVSFEENWTGRSTILTRLTFTRFFFNAATLLTRKT